MPYVLVITLYGMPNLMTIYSCVGPPDNHNCGIPIRSLCWRGSEPQLAASSGGMLAASAAPAPFCKSA